MAPKIARVSGSLFSPPAVSRKEGTDGEDASKKDSHQQNKEKKEDEPRQKADRASVDKAVSDLRVSGQFIQAGLKAEVIEAADGITVRMIHPNGTVIKTMTAEEFLKLRDASVGEKNTRGNILDQKF